MTGPTAAKQPAAQGRKTQSTTTERRCLPLLAIPPFQDLVLESNVDFSIILRLENARRGCPGVLNSFGEPDKRGLVGQLVKRRSGWQTAPNGRLTIGRRLT